LFTITLLETGGELCGFFVSFGHPSSIEQPVRRISVFNVPLSKVSQIIVSGRCALTLFS
jgi:hypothetical protein